MPLPALSKPDATGLGRGRLDGQSQQGGHCQGGCDRARVPGEDPIGWAVLRLALSPTPTYDEQTAGLRWVAVAMSSN